MGGKGRERERYCSPRFVTNFFRHFVLTKLWFLITQKKTSRRESLNRMQSGKIEYEKITKGLNKDLFHSIFLIDEKKIWRRLTPKRPPSLFAVLVFAALKFTKNCKKRGLFLAYFRFYTVVLVYVVWYFQERNPSNWNVNCMMLSKCSCKDKSKIGLQKA